MAVGLVNTAGISKNLRIYAQNGLPRLFNDLGATDQIQIGKGTTPVTRGDFNIENPFTNGGVEDNKISCLTFGYSSPLGKITIPTLISPTFGSGAITEVCHFFTAYDEVSGVFQFMSMHDIVPVSNFIAGQSVNVDYEVLI